MYPIGVIHSPYKESKDISIQGRFKDDIEFLIDESAKLIHFRSQSRIGGYDWNANRNRMENIRSIYNKT